MPSFCVSVKLTHSLSMSIFRSYVFPVYVYVCMCVCVFQDANFRPPVVVLSPMDNFKVIHSPYIYFPTHTHTHTHCIHISWTGISSVFSPTLPLFLALLHVVWKDDLMFSHLASPTQLSLSLATASMTQVPFLDSSIIQ